MNGLSLKAALQHSFTKYAELTAIDFKSIERKRNYTLTFSELHNVAQAFAAHIGASENYPVIILGTKDPASYASLLGCLLAERCFIPLNPDTPKALVSQIALSLGVTHLVGESELLKSFADLSLEGVALDCESAEWKVAFTNRGHSPKAPLPSNIAYIVATSGSTSAGKAIRITHETYFAYARNYFAFDTIAPGCRFSQVYGLGFDPALGEILFSFLSGGCLCPFVVEDLIHYPKLIASYELNRWWSTPTSAKLILRLLARSPDLKFASVIRSSFVGEILSRTLAERWLRHFPSSSIENTYGPTETTVVNTSQIFSAEQIRNWSFDSLPIGKPFGRNRINLLDESGLSVFEPGKIGEIVISGDQVGAGYVDGLARGYKEGSFSTGDLGVFTSDGDLMFAGRKALDFKVLGERINVDDIAAKFRDLLKVDWAFVIPHKGAEGKIVGVDAIISERVSEIALNFARTEIAKLILKKFVPISVYLTETIFVNANFKTDLKAIEDLIKNEKLERLL